MARPKKNEEKEVKNKLEDLESFGDDGEEDAPEVDEDGEEDEDAPPAPPKAVEPEPEVRTRKSIAQPAPAKIKKAAAEVKPTLDFVLDKKGVIRVDEEGDKMRFAPGFHKSVGFVNENGVLFPVGYKYRGGHVGSFGNVVLNRCPKCGNHQSIDEALSGACGNLRAGPDRTACGFNQVHELEQYTPKDFGLK